METRSSKTGPDTPAIEFRNLSLSLVETQAVMDVSSELWPGQTRGSTKRFSSTVRTPGA
jgi:hypothetical protein